MTERDQLREWLEDTAKRIVRKYTVTKNARGALEVSFQDGTKMVTIAALPRLVADSPAYITVTINSTDFVQGAYNFKYNVEVIGKRSPRKLTSRAAATLVKLLIEQADHLSNSLRATKLPRRSKQDLEFPF